MKARMPENPNRAIQYDPARLRMIFLAGGCFWGTQAYISRLPGVAQTRCGYANGHTDHPTYQEVCAGHTGYAETVEVSYDPSRLPLNRLLEGFFKTIDPTQKNRQGADYGSQYRSGIYFVDHADLSEIRQAIEREQEQYQLPIATEVLPLARFFPAEEYHQDYLEKNPGGYCHVNLDLLPKESKPFS